MTIFQKIGVLKRNRLLSSHTNGAHFKSRTRLLSSFFMPDFLQNVSPTLLLLHSTIYMHFPSHTRCLQTYISSPKSLIPGRNFCTPSMTISSSVFLTYSADVSSCRSLPFLHWLYIHTKIHRWEIVNSTTSCETAPGYFSQLGSVLFFTLLGSSGDANWKCGRADWDKKVAFWMSAEARDPAARLVLWLTMCERGRTTLCHGSLTKSSNIFSVIIYVSVARRSTSAVAEWWADWYARFNTRFPGMSHTHSRIPVQHWCHTVCGFTLKRATQCTHRVNYWGIHRSSC